VDVHRFRGRDGHELAYREIGSGRPLVLLHGFTGDSAQWIDSGPARLFADHGFRVILPDLRGHGQSTHPRYHPHAREECDAGACAGCHADARAGADADTRAGCRSGGGAEDRLDHPDVPAGYHPDARLGYRSGARAEDRPDLRGGCHADVCGGYYADVLADDGLALVEQFGDADLGGDYDLGGCSLGGRVVLRMLARVARPGRAIVAGQGLTAVTAPRANGLRDVLTALVNGDPPPDAGAAYWIKQGGNDPEELLRVLDTHVPTPEAALRQITTPTLVMIGDQDNANADELAAALPNGQFVRVPGDHYTSLGGSEFAEVALGFLNARRNVTQASTVR
jgi:pimeloyl-ACP methyl ester carboxylesterase